MRTKNLVTGTGFLNAPEDFLFIPLVVRESDQLRPPLKIHLVCNLAVEVPPRSLF